MTDKIDVGIHSEIGQLEAVILHTPGPEVENMTPLNAERALYSDILNLSVARKEYSQLNSLLGKLTKPYFVGDLLFDILKNPVVKEKLLEKVCRQEQASINVDELLDLDPKELARQLIEGVPIRRNNLTNYLNQENFSLRPLHNFFFTRDSSVSIYDRVLIAKMAKKVRERETMIMQAIFDHHPSFKTSTVNPADYPEFNEKISIEGGDILIAREDIMLMGIGERSTSEGVDFILNRLRELKDKRHIIIQELPRKPESFIHLDMAFTFLDRDSCLIYEPLIIKPNRYQTVHIKLDNGEVKSIQSVKNIPHVLKKLGMDLNFIYCGGRKDPVIQEREQWHSGANFFAIAPGKTIGYSRNIYTLEDMNNNGYHILKGKDVLSGRTDPSAYDKYVITIDGSELARGGGGIRCMTMPVKRSAVNW